MEQTVARVGLLMAAVLGAGCAMPKVPIYEPNKGVGVKFCTEQADRAQLVSTQEMGVSVFLLTLGGAAITASGVLATISANSTQYRQELGYLGAGLAVAPLIAVPFGMVLASRSDEASALAATSHTAIVVSDSDEDAFRDCVLGRAAWVGSRADATALAREALEEEKEKEKQRKAAEDNGEPEPEKPTADEPEKPTDAEREKPTADESE